MTANLLHGDCKEVLATLPENSIDTCVTDPPYHLKSIVKRFGKPGSAPAKEGSDGRYARVSKGFMGKEWDGGDIAFRKETWEAVYRVLKPGAMLLAFGGTRTYHRLTCAIEDAGFDIRDCIFWIYGSGFPKSHNLKIDGWDGWGTTLKPAAEMICVAMKPLDGTFAQSAEKWGVAGLNIDGGRIPTGELITNHARTSDGAKSKGIYGDSSEQRTHQTSGQRLGRWPANVILDEVAARVLDEQSGVSTSRQGKPRGTKKKGLFANSEFNKVGTEHNDTGGASRFFYVAKASKSERWIYLTCNCEAVILGTWVNEGHDQAEQTDATLPPRDISEDTLADDYDSSTLLFGRPSTENSQADIQSTISMEIKQTTASKISAPLPQQNISESAQGASGETESGGSRVESVASTKRLTEIVGTYLPKDGLSTGVVVPATLASSFAKSVCVKCGEPVKIHSHPTQKPIALMRYLCKLTATPTGGTVLDPFMGSGTTGMAAVMEGRDFVGIEKELEYVEISKRRIDWAKSKQETKQLTLF